MTRCSGMPISTIGSLCSTILMPAMVPAVSSPTRMWIGLLEYPSALTYWVFR